MLINSKSKREVIKQSEQISSKTSQKNEKK